MYCNEKTKKSTPLKESSEEELTGLIEYFKVVRPLPENQTEEHKC